MASCGRASRRHLSARASGGRLRSAQRVMAFLRTEPAAGMLPSRAQKEPDAHDYRLRHLRLGRYSMEVETHGNDPVPPESRRQGWFAFFALYSGVNICLPLMLVGSAFVPGLSLPQAVLAGLLGNGLAFAISSVAAYPGTDHGLPTPVLTRASLAYPWGTWLPSLAILASSIGWFAVHTELAAMALDGLLRKLTGWSGPLIVPIVLMGAANAFVAIIGFNWIRKLAAVAVPLLLVLSVLLLSRIASNHSLPDILSRPGLGPLSFLGAVNIVVSAQMGSAFTAADFARYSRNHRSVWIGSLSVAPVAAFMMALGAISALATGEANPVLGVQSLGLGVGALVVIGLATWTTSDKVLYSGGLALTNVFPKWPRWLNTLLLGAVGNRHRKPPIDPTLYPVVDSLGYHLCTVGGAADRGLLCVSTTKTRGHGGLGRELGSLS